MSPSYSLNFKESSLTHKSIIHRWSVLKDTPPSKPLVIMRNLQSNIGVQFTNIGDTERRGEMSGYHRSPETIFRLDATAEDVNGLSASDKLNVDGNKAKFAIGFEVEKTTLRRGAVMEYPLFKGFERDNSCGYEAVTHVLPLVGRSMWRTKVFNMFC